MSSGTASVVCRACGGNQLQLFKQMPSLVGNHVCRFYRCRECGSISELGGKVLDYSAGEGSPELKASIHYYLEFGANLGFMTGLVQILQSALPPRTESRPPRFLDVGAGMGFCVDIARHLGWEAIGVEPSPRGSIGANLLGVTILPQYLEDTDLAPESFNCVLSTEVLEHVVAADAFIGTLLRYLSPDGVMLLTTPNASFVELPEESTTEIEQVFSPGHHQTLYTAQGLRRLLERQGAKQVQIGHYGGRSGLKHLVAIVAKQDGVLLADVEQSLQRLQDGSGLRQYCEALIAQRRNDGNRDMVYWGAVFRLFEHYVNSGSYPQAEPLAEELDEYLAHRGLSEERLLAWRPASLIEYAEQAPCFLGRYQYLRAMLAMNYQADLPQAERRFRVAGHLCGIEEGFPGNLYLGNMAEQARLHVAIALARQGKTEQAVAIFDDLIARRHLLPENIFKRAVFEKTSAMVAAGRGVGAALTLAEIAAARYLPLRSADAQDSFHQFLVALENPISRLTNKVSCYAARLEQLSGAAARAEQLLLPRLEQWAEKAEVAETRLKQILNQTEQLLSAGAEAMRAVRPLARLLRATLTSLASVARWPKKTWRRLRGWLQFGTDVLTVEQVQAISRKAAEATTQPDEAPLALGKLVSGMVVEQDFNCPEDGLAGVKLMLGGAERLGQSNMHVALLNAAGEVLRELVQPSCNLGNGKTNILSFPPVVDSGGKQFRIRLHSAEAPAEEAVTLWARPTRGHAGMFVNGKPVIDAQLVVEPVCRQASTQIKPVSGAARDLLIVTPDRLGATRVGLAMRHWEIAQALSGHGLRVTLASTRPIASDCPRAEFPVLTLPEGTDQQLRLAREHAAVMVQGTVLDWHPALGQADRPLVADMVCPLHIENLSLPDKDPYLHGLRAVSQCLQRADFFICGNERQRLYWLGMLTAIGRLDKRQAAEDPDFRRLVDVVHFGIAEQPPQKTRQVLKGVRTGIAADDFVLVWFGGIWEWLDPAPLIRAVHAAHQTNPRIKLFFSMYRRPNEQPHAAAVRARRLCEELRAADRSIFFNELPIPYAERGDYLLECDLGVIVQPANLETAVSARTRAMDYFWAGLPMLINRGDEIADLVERHGMGIVLKSDDPEHIRQALLEYVEDRPRQQRAAAAVAAIAAQFRWSQTVKPLVEFCHRVIGQRQLRKAA